jgi:uncharacterized protein with NAD-binding domain and iron-sulfur cluster
MEHVIILGGGMAGLAAAYELSSTPQLQQRFHVTLYQKGWRLGGKCASSRGTHPAEPSTMRVEEHGLHVWFGFYFNSFHMLRDCYGQLGAPYIFRDMFARRSSTPLMELVDTRWLLWPLDFPEDARGIEPGVDPNFPSFRRAIARLIELALDNMERIAKSLPAQAVTGLADSLNWLGGILAPADDRLALRLFPRRAVLPLMAWTDTAVARWQGIRTAIDRVGSAHAGPAQTRLRDELRRAWIIADLAAATARGLLKDPKIALLGLDVLDNRDLRDWLVDCGADRESVSSAPVRALYDLCFAYTDGNSSTFDSARFAAGAALRCILRITLGYSGAICYSMNCGMGEAVIAPMYEVLRRNGVKFEFFHRVDDIQVRGGRVSAVRVTRQAKTKTGAAYQPTVPSPTGLMSWRAGPDFAQLEHGDLLEQTGLDFESDLGPDSGHHEPLTLDLEQPRTALILAISIAGLRRISAALDQPGSEWRHMLDTIPTVGTQAAQLWMKKDLRALGYATPERPPAMIAAPEPMDVWADMTSVRADEGWPGNRQPASVQFICGPLAGHPAPAAARELVERNTATWLQEMARAAWPGVAVTPAGFDWDCLMASAGTRGRARLAQQHLRANLEGSERYVLSVPGSTAARLRPDSKPASNLFLAGDWTWNGVNAGCVEAAVMSGMQAARAVRGDPPYTMPGARDWR